jgi:hypothetical protein
MTEPKRRIIKLPEVKETYKIKDLPTILIQKLKLPEGYDPEEEITIETIPRMRKIKQTEEERKTKVRECAKKYYYEHHEEMLEKARQRKNTGYYKDPKIMEQARERKRRQYQRLKQKKNEETNIIYTLD